MKRRIILLSLLQLTVASSSANASFVSQSLVEELIQRLETPWSDASCRENILSILHGVQNNTLWATWVWDSMQLPVGKFYGSGYSLGAYDQCLKNPWSSYPGMKTQYCLVDVKGHTPMGYREFNLYDSANDYLNTLSKAGQIFNQLTISACMPTECSPSSIAKFYRYLLQLTYYSDAEVTVDARNCQGKEEPSADRFYTYMFVMGVLLALVIFSTIYTNFCVKKDCKDAASSSMEKDGFFRAFCASRNWKELFKQPSDDIKIIHGLKVLCSLTVIMSHLFLLIFVEKTNMAINGVDIDKLAQTDLGQSVAHGDLSVDVFFAMSGLLFAKNLLSRKQTNLCLVILKRYLRLIGPYAAATLYTLSVARHTGDGPIWPWSTGTEQLFCEKTWWRNLLMLSTDISVFCLGVGWYIPCDFHLSILCLLLFWVYRRSEKNGVRAFAAVTVILTANLAVKAYLMELPVLVFGDRHKVSNIREYAVMNDVYLYWYDRAGAYLVGVAMGWLLVKYKPADHRHTFSKTSSFIIFACSALLMVKMITITQWLGDDLMEVAVAVATNRAVFAMGCCGLIFVSEYGSLPVIGDFLGSSFFVPLSRLSFGIYLTHFFVLQRYWHTLRTPVFLDVFCMIVNVLGIFVVSALAGLVLYLLVEAPFTNLGNILLSERKKELPPVKTSNGKITTKSG